jgi:hypothetical protein
VLEPLPERDIDANAVFRLQAAPLVVATGVSRLLPLTAVRMLALAAFVQAPDARGVQLPPSNSRFGGAEMS